MNKLDFDINEIKDKDERQRIYKQLRNKQRRTLILNITSIILAVSGLVWAVYEFLRFYRYEITNDATIEQYIAPVNTRISGYIRDVYFTDHQWVNIGDTLAVIDDREFRIKLMDAQAALMDAEASSSVLASNITTTYVNVAVSDANIEEAKARLWKLEQDYKRYENLLKTGAVSKLQFEQMKADLAASKAHYDALLKQRESVRSVSNETGKRRKNMEANILRKKADLDMAVLNMSYTVIIAPYSGYVGRRTMEVGQYVQAGQTITSLIRSDNKWVIANYREKQIQNIYIGQEINIRVDAISGKVFKGKVSAISEATGSKYSMIPTDNAAGNFVKIQQRIPVKIEFSNLSTEDRDKMRAGMMVETEAILK